MVYGVAFGDRLDSTACTSASIELVANTPKGSPSRSCGMSTAASAYMAGPTSPIFVPRRVRFRIEMLVTSLPVPQVVGMRTSSRRLGSSGAMPYSSSMLSPPPTASTLAMSMTVPPPMATTRLQPVAAASRRMASAITSVGSPMPYCSWYSTAHSRFIAQK